MTFSMASRRNKAFMKSLPKCHMSSPVNFFCTTHPMFSKKSASFTPIAGRLSASCTLDSRMAMRITDSNHEFVATAAHALLLADAGGMTQNVCSLRSVLN